MDQPNCLLFFLGSPSSYRTPMFSANEVFVGPDVDDQRDEDTGKWVSMKVDAGEVDADVIMARLDDSQKPEYIIVKADATRRLQVSNLDHFPGKKVLIWGDSHHQGNGIHFLLEYARSQPFDAILTDHDRHHMVFPLAAGFRNVGWIPALNYVHRSRPIPAHASIPVSFVGQVGQYHPYRRHVLDQLIQSGVSVSIVQCSPDKAADIYAASGISLNISLNGDLNLRVFEILSAGGFLMTDRLGRNSGLYELFTEGKHFVDFGTVDEAREKIDYYLNHPEEAMRIRKAGQARIAELYQPDLLKHCFFNWINGGELPPPFALEGNTNGPDSLETTGDLAFLAFYEFIQEIHLHSRGLKLYPVNCDEQVLSEVARLPRVSIERRLDNLVVDTRPVPFRRVPFSSYEVLVLGVQVEKDLLCQVLARFQGSFITAPQGLPELFNPAEWGWFKFPMDGEYFVRGDMLKELEKSILYLTPEECHLRLKGYLDICEDPRDCLKLVGWALEFESIPLAEAMLLKAIRLDRSFIPAYTTLAKLYMLNGQQGNVWQLLEEASRVSHLNGEWESMRRSLEPRFAGNEEFTSYRRMVGTEKPQAAELSRRILIITNLLPPQELGGNGRQIYEFALGLMRRGHDLRILTANMPELSRKGESGDPELDGLITRSLRLFGHWSEGRRHVETNLGIIEEISLQNEREVIKVCDDFDPEWVLVGNLQFLGLHFLRHLLRRPLPVLHCVSNNTTDYPVDEYPKENFYRTGPCSKWTARKLLATGYPVEDHTVVYPGARLSRFYRLMRPNGRRLRLCYASLVMPFKGAQLLVEACHKLSRWGVDFCCEIAGDSMDPQFVENLKTFVNLNGLVERVSFPGFLDRQGLSDLFNRSNVLVFPSVFEEPFGISQVEAMTSGLVVVSSGTGGACEIVEHGVSGLIHERENADSLANQLLFLAEHPKVLEAMSEAAQKRAEVFSVDHSVRVIESSLKELEERALASSRG